MRPSKIRAKLARDEPALCTTLHLNDPSVFELTSLMGFDGIWLDLEHHAHSVEMAGQLMRAARVGSADVVARPAKGEFMRMGRLLEAGAQAIMYPRCDGPEEAAEVVRWAKFAPLGQRGLDCGNPDALYSAAPLAEYLAHANRETFIIIQLEHDRAVNQAEAIAVTPGIDAIMLGPGDYSLLEGFPGQMDHPRFEAVLQKMAAAAKNAGKHLALPVANAEHAKSSLELGARLFFCGADISFVKNGLERLQQQFSPLGFTFDPRFATKSGS